VPPFESLRACPEALTEFTAARPDIQGVNNGSAHEKLHALAAHMGLKRFPSAGIL
jgi:hypothetical protein